VKALALPVWRSFGIKQNKMLSKDNGNTNISINNG
jgi:hypothetical protein